GPAGGPAVDRPTAAGLVGNQLTLRSRRPVGGGAMAAGPASTNTGRFDTVASGRQQLQDVTYLADEGIAGVVFLADRLGKPVLVEGPAGTGKTQLAKSVAEISGARLIRLQCYEGLDE